MILTAAGAAALWSGGLWLLWAAPVGLWSTLLGLQLAAMGLYLLVLAGLGRADVLRPLMLARVPLSVGTAACGFPLLALLEAAWGLAAAGTLWHGRDREALGRPSRLHNLCLGLFPVVEGALCVLAGEPTSRFLYEAGVVQPWGTLFGLQSLFLGVFWWLCVARGCWSGLAITVAGRLLVAAAFAALWWGGASARLGLLSAALIVSCAWSAMELRQRLR